MEEVNTDQIVERDGGASCQLDENQLQLMDVSLDQKATTTATKQRAGTQLTTNNVGSGIGGLRSNAGHQAERTESMLTIEAMKKSSVNAIVDVSHKYDHYTRKLWDRDKYIAKRKNEFDQMEVLSVRRRVKKSRAADDTYVRMAADPI